MNRQFFIKMLELREVTGLTDGDVKGSTAEHLESPVTSGDERLQRPDRSVRPETPAPVLMTQLPGGEQKHSSEVRSKQPGHSEPPQQTERQMF